MDHKKSAPLAGERPQTKFSKTAGSTTGLQGRHPHESERESLKC